MGTHAKNIKADNFNETFSIQSNKDNSSEEVDAITMSQILLKNDFKNIDILKIDIEGAERYIFDESSKDWIDKVNVIIFLIINLSFLSCNPIKQVAILRLSCSLTFHCKVSSWID